MELTETQKAVTGSEASAPSVGEAAGCGVAVALRVDPNAGLPARLEALRESIDNPSVHIIAMSDGSLSAELHEAVSRLENTLVVKSLPSSSLPAFLHRYVVEKNGGGARHAIRTVVSLPHERVLVAGERLGRLVAAACARQDEQREPVIIARLATVSNVDPKAHDWAQGAVEQVHLSPPAASGEDAALVVLPASLLRVMAVDADLAGMSGIEGDGAVINNIVRRAAAAHGSAFEVLDGTGVHAAFVLASSETATRGASAANMGMQQLASAASLASGTLEVVDAKDKHGHFLYSFIPSLCLRVAGAGNPCTALPLQRYASTLAGDGSGAGAAVVASGAIAASDASHAEEIDEEEEEDAADEAEKCHLRIFTAPKGMNGHVNVTQRNAIISWTKMKPRPDVVLMGDDPGVAAFAREIGVKHIGKLKTTKHGTPLLDDIFAKARRGFQGHLLAYVNADIILLQDFADAVQCSCHKLQEFLMIGIRTNTPWKGGLIDFAKKDWADEVRHVAETKGKPFQDDAEDYFVFTKHMYQEMPPFALGRMVWDNWMVHQVVWMNGNGGHNHGINANAAVLAVHQDHDYSHLAHKSKNPWDGDEYQSNLRLAKVKGYGHGFISGSQYKLKKGPECCLWDSHAAVEDRDCLPDVVPHKTRHRIG